MEDNVSTNHLPEEPVPIPEVIEGPTQPARNEDDLNVRSDEVQQIIGRPPHGLVRWGVSVFIGVLALILLSTWFVKYPEVIHAPLNLRAVHAPKTIESRVSGQLVRLIAKNNVEVAQGQVLAWLESTANHETVFNLASRLEDMRSWILNEEFDHFHSLQWDHFTDLGPLQSGFQSFEQAYREFISFLTDGLYHRQQEVLRQELVYTQMLMDKLTEQKQIQQAEYELANREYQMQQHLAERNVIAPIELDREESNLLSRQLPLRQTEASIINNYISQTAKEQEILELERRISEQKAVFFQQINTLKSAIDDWKRDHLMTAPFSGRLIYAGILQENQLLVQGQEIFYIEPENSEYFGELAISQQSFGKIEEGQQVLVRFNGYPYHEFGTVEGTLDYMSGFPVRDSVFLGKVIFPQELNTNYGQQLIPRNGMTGQAEIITQDMRLMERIINNIVKELH